MSTVYPQPNDPGKLPYVAEDGGLAGLRRQAQPAELPPVPTETKSARPLPFAEKSKLLTHVVEDGGLSALRSTHDTGGARLGDSSGTLLAKPGDKSRLLTQVTEDGGLSALRSTKDFDNNAWMYETTIRQAAADALRSGLAQEFLDPFAPVEARRQAVASCLSTAIVEARQLGLPLGRVPADLEAFDQLFAATLGWGPAQRYLDDPRVNEVKIVGTTIRVQELGKPFVTVRERFASEEEAVSRAQLLASLLGVPLDASKPQVTLPLGHGTRMHVSIEPRTKNGALICIRRGRNVAWDLEDLLARGSLDQPTADLLQLLCRARCSMLIIGRTGSGKTALLEALANSWPGDPHIITIEDYTMEIGIKPDVTWTRELVDTHVDPQAFGLVAREALRQTPDLVLPGETRANEAGAILSLVLSDHPVITTIHARSAADGVERFASCAALPGSYMYEGRRNDALRDAADGFDVAIKIDFWAESGRRVITEVALTNGVVDGPVGQVASVLPLVKLDVAEDGTMVWVPNVKVDDDRLYWIDGVERTPERVREKLERARIVRSARPLAPTLDIVSEALRRAEPLLANGQPLRALEPLKDAWKQRRDGKLLQMAQRVLVSLPQIRQDAAAETASAVAQLDTLIEQRRWNEAFSILSSILEDVVHAAAHIPAGGWERYEQRLSLARQASQQARELITQAQSELDHGRPRQVISMLEQYDTTLLDTDTLLTVEDLRITALHALVARGDAANHALEAAQVRRDGIARSAGIVPGGRP